MASSILWYAKDSQRNVLEFLKKVVKESTISFPSSYHTQINYAGLSIVIVYVTTYIASVETALSSFVSSSARLKMLPVYIKAIAEASEVITKLLRAHSALLKTLISVRYKNTSNLL